MYEEDDGQDEEELRDTLMRVSRLSPSSSGGRPVAAGAPASASAAPAASTAAPSGSTAPVPFPGYPSSLLSELLTILRRADVITRGWFSCWGCLPLHHTVPVRPTLGRC